MEKLAVACSAFRVLVCDLGFDFDYSMSTQYYALLTLRASRSVGLIGGSVSIQIKDHGYWPDLFV